jgi:hypothetical protein
MQANNHQWSSGAVIFSIDELQHVALPVAPMDAHTGECILIGGSTLDAMDGDQ